MAAFCVCMRFSIKMHPIVYLLIWNNIGGLNGLYKLYGIFAVNLADNQV